GIAACAAAGVVIAYSAHFEQAMLLALLGLCCALPTAMRVVQHRFDPFEPIIVMSWALAVLFVARPLAQLAYHSPIYLGWDVRPGFDRALFIALVGILALYGGYVVGTGRQIAAKVPAPPGEWSASSAVRFAIIAVLLAIALIVALVHSIGAGAAS